MSWKNNYILWLFWFFESSYWLIAIEKYVHVRIVVHPLLAWYEEEENDFLESTVSPNKTWIRENYLNLLTKDPCKKIWKLN